jgi:hypothetical protein
MIKSKLTLGLVFLFSVSFFFYSCKEEETPLTAYGDVLIKSVQSDDSVLYGIYYFAYSWEKMTKATVYREGENTKITLDSIEGRYTYTHIPDSSEFVTSKPHRANYIFNVEFDNGEQYEASDILDSTALTPPVIKECYFDQEDGRLVIDWEANTLADLYFVVLERDNKEIVFQSEALSVSKTVLWISSSSYGWLTNKQPEGGEKYRVIISAYQYEPVPSSFDLQSVSEAKSGIIEWVVNNELN